MVHQALVEELAVKFTELLKDTEGAGNLSLSDLMRVVTIALNHFHDSSAQKHCSHCRVDVLDSLE